MEWGGGVGVGSINKQTGNEGIPRTNRRGKKKQRQSKSRTPGVSDSAWLLKATGRHILGPFFNPHGVFQISIRQRVIPPPFNEVRKL